MARIENRKHPSKKGEPIKWIKGDSYRITVYVGRDENQKLIVERETYNPEATAPTKIQKEVEAFASRFEEEVKNGKYRSGNKITFAQFFETWKKDYAEKNLTLSVRESYERVISNTIKDETFLRTLPINRIRVGHLQPILDKKAETSGDKTVRYLLTCLNSVFRFAFSMDVIDENPCLRCTKPKQKKTTYKDIHFFTIPQAKTFLAALDRSFEHPVKERTRTDSNGNTYSVKPYNASFSINHQWKAYFYLAIYGGFRRGEIVALTWEDINFKDRTVSINKAAARTKKEGQIIKEPKTVSGVREIVLPAKCFEVLSSWKREQMELCSILGSAWVGYRGKEYVKNHIFIQLDSGKMMDLATPSHKFKEILTYYNASCENEEDKLPEIHLHDLRHTAITQYLVNGGDIETASHRHGHSKASVTMDVYGHWTKEADNEASDSLERLFG